MGVVIFHNDGLTGYCCNGILTTSSHLRDKCTSYSRASKDTTLTIHCIGTVLLHVINQMAS